MCHGYIYIYICHWCSGIQGIYALSIYIYRSAFGVIVFKASMLDCGGPSAMGICALSIYL